MARRRVSLGEAFKMALKGMQNAPGGSSSQAGDLDLLIPAMIPAYALYWWIFGVPEDWKKS